MKWTFPVLFILIIACHVKQPPCFISASDIVHGSLKKMIMVRDSGYKIAALYDEGWDSLKGGAYLFFPNELLKSYTFYQNKLPVYTEEYDAQGYLTHTKGCPMVDRVINELGEDSVYVEVHFFSPKKNYQQLHIRINQNAPVDYVLRADTVFSNIRSVTFGMNTGGMNSLNMNSRIIYTDECTKIEHVLSDSLFLIKDSHNGLVPATAK